MVWESRTANPMVPLGFFRKRSFDASAILVAFVGLSLFGIIFFLTLYFQNVKGWSPQEAGARTLPLTVHDDAHRAARGQAQTRDSARAC